jgi:hypothetical protein
MHVLLSLFSDFSHLIQFVSDILVLTLVDTHIFLHLFFFMPKHMQTNFPIESHFLLREMSLVESMILER